MLYVHIYWLIVIFSSLAPLMAESFSKEEYSRENVLGLSLNSPEIISEPHGEEIFSEQSEQNGM